MKIKILTLAEGLKEILSSKLNEFGLTVEAVEKIKLKGKIG